MELTPKLFDDVEFREKFRGYDPEEVDAFLEQVARGVDLLQQRVREASERAERAETRAAEVPASNSSADEEILRTIRLAQRTADAAVAEANERAAAREAEADRRATARLNDAEERATARLAEAEERATTQIADADEYAHRVRREADEYAANIRAHADVERARLRAEAEQEVRARADELRHKLRDEIAALEEAREKLRVDIGRFDGHLANERAKLDAVIASLTTLRDDPAALAAESAPEPTAIVLPPPVVPDEPTPPTVPFVAPGTGVAAATTAAEVAAMATAATLSTLLPTIPIEAEVAPDLTADEVGARAATVEAAELAPPSVADVAREAVAGTAPEPSARHEVSPPAPNEPVDLDLTAPVDMAAELAEPWGMAIDDTPTAEVPSITTAPATEPPAAEPPVTEAIPVIGGDADDAYLAELRRAIEQPTDLGSRDDSDLEAAFSRFYDIDTGADADKQGWFRRRK